MKSIKKIKKGILLLMALCMVLYGCRKNEIGNVNLKTDNLLEKVFKNSANVKPEFLPDVSTIRDGLSKNEALLKKISGEVMWTHIASRKNGQFVVVPVNKNGEKSIEGFLLLNKKDPNRKFTEYYPFVLNVERNKKTLNLKQSFLTNLVLNKTINGVIKYEFNNIEQTPYLFRKLIKAEENKAIPVGSKVTISISNKTESLNNVEEETGMAISFNECNWTCEDAETPNFIFVPVCWCEGDWGTGGNDNSWWPNDWYVDPYGNQNGGGSGNGPSSLDAMFVAVMHSLWLDPGTYQNLYQSHPQNFVQLYYYLQNSANSLTQMERATDHLVQLNAAYFGTPSTYSNFVYNQQATSADPNFLWWEDTNWLTTGGNNLLPAQLLSVDRSSGVTDPRLAALLQKIQNPTFQSTLLKTYFSSTPPIPYAPKKFKVKFTEVTTLVGASGQQVPGQTNVVALPNDEYEVEVKLNLSMFQNTSQEWVAAIILHELVHGILSVTAPSLDTNLKVHNFMFDKSVPIMIHQSLREVFPNIDQHKAIALGMDGLAEIWTISDPNNPGQFIIDPQKDTLTRLRYYQTLAEAIYTINQYHTAVSGTPF